MGMSPLNFRTLAVLLTTVASIANCIAADLTFKGNALQAVSVEPTASSGLQNVYVLSSMEGVRVSYESPTGAQVSWQRYSALGGGYAETVASTQSGAVSTLTNPEGNMGYIITDGSTTHCFWIVDYSAYEPVLTALALSDQTDCSTTWLDFTGTGNAITYFGITGQPAEINREFTLSYRTLEFDPESFGYRQVERSETLSSLAEHIHCQPALCQTDFTLSGDRFTRQWGRDKEITSPTYEPTAIESQTRAVQESRSNLNEVKDDTPLGGSGPVEITFSAAVTDGALYHEWELARDPEFNQTFLRYSDLEFTHTFREQGTTYVRLLTANATASCEGESETYTVTVGESMLKCPNAFSPGVSEGVNDEWKVTYKSIIEFDCHIFDRTGRELAHLTDPAQGWDGKISGKTAPAGVYFYVIRALGADGKKYKLSGDINIIGYNNPKTNATK